MGKVTRARNLGGIDLSIARQALVGSAFLGLTQKIQFRKLCDKSRHVGGRARDVYGKDRRSTVQALEWAAF